MDCREGPGTAEVVLVNDSPRTDLVVVDQAAVEVRHVEEDIPKKQMQEDMVAE
jgi:hypothetical protein